MTLSAFMYGQDDAPFFPIRTRYGQAMDWFLATGTPYLNRGTWVTYSSAPHSCFFIPGWPYP